ncbi:Sulfhydrogenase 1 subunit delta [uncultured archaeon]|nr:Sulfhydrogenase 1 subunit delta [uncultured archaeon]
MAGKKLRIGWFSFTCCEDSTIVWVEMMNENYFKWKDLLDIRHARVLRKINDMAELDVAFVEGAITTESDAKKLIEIRNNSKVLVAIGSCACVAMPAGQRNTFDQETKKEIDFLVKRFRQTDKVRSLKEIVKVDDQVEGCPMDEAAFLRTLDKYLKQFGVVDA